MLCKHCGAELVDGGIFCPACGKRIDGKKECPNCQKLILEQSTFCTYCGARVDGKKICATCGAEVEHAFCEKCGTLYGKEKRASKAVKKDHGKEIGVLASTLMLCALVALFVCSFFIGGTVCERIFFKPNNYYVKEFSPRSIFYFFKGYFDAIGDMECVSSDELYSEEALGYEIQAVVIAVLLLANLVLIATMTTVAIIKYIRGLRTGKQVDIVKQSVWSLASFVAAAVVVATGCGLVRSRSDLADLQIFKMTDGSIAGIIIGFTLIAGAIVLLLTQKKREDFDWKNVGQLMLSVIGVVIVSAMIFVVSGCAVKTTQEDFPQVLSTGKYMQLAFGELRDGNGTFGFLTASLWFLSLATTAILFVLFAKLAQATLKKYKSTHSTVLLSIVSAGLSAVYLALSIITRAHANNSVDYHLIDADCVTLGGPIAVFVLSMVLIAVVGVMWIFGKKEEVKIEQQTEQVSQ